MKPDILINEVSQLLSSPDKLIGHLNNLSQSLSRTKPLNPKWKTPDQIRFKQNQMVSAPSHKSPQELFQTYGMGQSPEQQRYNPFLRGENRAVVIVSKKPELFFSDFHGDLGSFLLALPEMLEALEAGKTVILGGDTISPFPADFFHKSFELFVYVSVLMAKYPNQFHWIMGNHDYSAISDIISKKKELRSCIYPEIQTNGLLEKVDEISNAVAAVLTGLPLMAVSKSTNTLYFHGDVPPLSEDTSLAAMLSACTVRTKENACECPDIMSGGVNTDNLLRLLGSMPGINVTFGHSHISSREYKEDRSYEIKALPESHQVTTVYSANLMQPWPNYEGHALELGPRYAERLDAQTVVIRPIREQEQYKENPALTENIQIWKNLLLGFIKQNLNADFLFEQEVFCWPKEYEMMLGLLNKHFESNTDRFKNIIRKMLVSVLSNSAKKEGDANLLGQHGIFASASDEADLTPKIKFASKDIPTNIFITAIAIEATRQGNIDGFVSQNREFIENVSALYSAYSEFKSWNNAFTSTYPPEVIASIIRKHNYLIMQISNKDKFEPEKVCYFFIPSLLADSAKNTLNTSISIEEQASDFFKSKDCHVFAYDSADNYRTGYDYDEVKDKILSEKVQKIDAVINKVLTDKENPSSLLSVKTKPEEKVQEQATHDHIPKQPSLSDL